MARFTASARPRGTERTLLAPQAFFDRPIIRWSSVQRPCRKRQQTRRRSGSSNGTPSRAGAASHVPFARPQSGNEAAAQAVAIGFGISSLPTSCAADPQPLKNARTAHPCGRDAETEAMVAGLRQARMLVGMQRGVNKQKGAATQGG